MVLLSLLAAGCGYSTPPLPLSRIIPPTAGVRAWQRGEDIIVAWQSPDGAQLLRYDGLRGFELSVQAERLLCPECLPGPPRHISLAAGAPELTAHGNELYYTLPLQPDDGRLHIAVSTRFGVGRSPAGRSAVVERAGTIPQPELAWRQFGEPPPPAPAPAPREAMDARRAAAGGEAWGLPGCASGAGAPDEGWSVTLADLWTAQVRAPVRVDPREVWGAAGGEAWGLAQGEPWDLPLVDRPTRTRIGRPGVADPAPADDGTAGPGAERTWVVIPHELWGATAGDLWGRAAGGPFGAGLFASIAARPALQFYWEAPRERIVQIIGADGRPRERVQHYRANLYRRVPPSPWPPAPINPVPVQETALQVTSLGAALLPTALGEEYVLRYVDQFGNEGPPSAPVLIRPAGCAP